MTSTDADRALDRHALVTAIWTAGGLVAATLFHFGLGSGGAPSLLAGFGAVIATFAGHVVVNAVSGTTFTRRELALGLVLYAVALVAFGLATLTSPGFAASAFLPGSAGFVLIFAAGLFYLVTSAGLRGAFEAFNVVRSFRASARPGSASAEGSE